MNNKIPSKYTIITFLIIILGSLFAYKSSAEDYLYLDINAGHWFDSNYKGEEPDGKIPVNFAFGKAWEEDKHRLYIEARHRSNLDLGWPVTSAGDKEYSRNGIFSGFTYKFK